MTAIGVVDAHLEPAEDQVFGIEAIQQLIEPIEQQIRRIARRERKRPLLDGPDRRRVRDMHRKQPACRLDKQRVQRRGFDPQSQIGRMLEEFVQVCPSRLDQC